MGREYLRVSMDASGVRRSEDEQHGDNQAWATGEGITLGTPYMEDAAISASRFARRARAGFGALIDDLRSGQFRARYLLLWESSRGSRQVGEWVTLLDLAAAAKVLIRVHTHGRVYDPANARDRRTLLEDAVDDEYASAQASTRIRRAMNANVAAGRPHGQVPYGYRREYGIGAGGRRILLGQFPDPATAKIVSGIFRDILGGRTLRSIAAALNTVGVPSPAGKRWSVQQIRRIALNPVYAGKRSHHGQIYDGSWEPLVDLETWYAVRDLLTNPARRTSRPGRVRHMLSQIAGCAVCGSPMQVRLHRGYGEYWCHAGNHVWIPQAALDTYISDLMIARLGQPDLWPVLAEATDDADRQAARDELAEAEGRHKEMIRAMGTGKMTVTAFTTAEPLVVADIDAAQRRVDAMQLPPSLVVFNEAARAKGVRVAWYDSTVAAQRDLIRAFMEEIKVARPGPSGSKGRALLTLTATAPDGTVLRTRASSPFTIAALMQHASGGWEIMARGRNPELVANDARLNARAGDYLPEVKMAGLFNDPMVVERVTFEWRGRPAA